MKDNLRESLENYKEVTIELIKLIQSEDFDSLDKLFQERQNEIDKMDCMNYIRVHFLEICEELSILTLDEQLQAEMGEKRNYLRTQIIKFAETKIASKSYSKRQQVDSIYFNQKR